VKIAQHSVAVIMKRVVVVTAAPAPANRRRELLAARRCRRTEQRRSRRESQARRGRCRRRRPRRRDVTSSTCAPTSNFGDNVLVAMSEALLWPLAWKSSARRLPPAGRGVSFIPRTGISGDNNFCPLPGTLPSSGRLQFYGHIWVSAIMGDNLLSPDDIRQEPSA
jgi:hypothetical protein